MSVSRGLPPAALAGSSLNKRPCCIRQIARITPFVRRMLLARRLGPHSSPRCVVRPKPLNHEGFFRFKNFPVRLSDVILDRLRAGRAKLHAIGGP